MLGLWFSTRGLDALIEMEEPEGAVINVVDGDDALSLGLNVDVVMGLGIASPGEDSLAGVPDDVQLEVADRFGFALVQSGRLGAAWAHRRTSFRFVLEGGFEARSHLLPVFRPRPEPNRSNALRVSPEDVISDVLLGPYLGVAAAF